MKINFNTLDRQYFKYKNEYDNAYLNTMESGNYILGNQVIQFEKEFASFIGCEECVGVNSGLDALILAIKSLDIGKGDEVIVPANTYIATILAITENHATPIFVEPDQYYNIDVEKIEEKITQKTKAILVVHLYGQACNMKKIKEICIKNNLYLVEDCAQAHMANYDNKMTGSFGDIGCFSFYPTKNLGAFGDGGAITTNNFEISEKVRMLRNYGSKHKYQNDMTGMNSRLDELQAALLTVKLKHLKELINERQNIANYYLNHINNKLIVLPLIQSKNNHVWHLFVIRCKQRDKLQKYLEINGIQTAIHYPIPPHLAKCYKRLGYKVGDLPITEQFSSEILSLPLFNGMKQEEIKFVVETINKFKEI
ncbi:MAG: DegT/DnrJ/EryC1/StrS family aminotransferase [Bacilli bacterium]